MDDDGVLSPFIPKDSLMVQPWVDCLHWAIADPNVLQQFIDETGSPRPAGNALDRMIDQATGADRALVVKFVAWFNERVWFDQAKLDRSIADEKQGVRRYSIKEVHDKLRRG